MSILVTERWSERKLSYNAGGYRATRGFDVTGVSTKSAAVAAVVAYDPTTAYNHTHPESTWIYVDNQDADCPGFNVWHVTISYSSTPKGRHTDPGNPLSEPFEYHFEWGTTTESIDSTYTGALLTNSAIQPFDSAPPCDILNGILTVERNEPFYDARSAIARSNMVNSANVTFGAAWLLYKGQACCRRIVPVSVITSASLYARVRYTIELRAGFVLDSDGYWDGFKTRVLDAGKRGYYSASGTATPGPVVETVGGQLQNVGFDVRLNGAGKPIETKYLIGTSSASAAAIASPIALPSSITTETTVDGTGAPLAVFLKFFPRGVRVGDLNALGL